MKERVEDAWELRKDRKENRELKGKSEEEGGMKVMEEGGIEWEWSRSKRKEIGRRRIEREYE